MNYASTTWAARDKALRDIKRARECRVRVGFGVSKQTVRITKKLARHLMQSSWSQFTRADLDGDTLYLRDADQ